jgi:hypothetical protein
MVSIGVVLHETIYIYIYLFIFFWCFLGVFILEDNLVFLWCQIG